MKMKKIVSLTLASAMVVAPTAQALAATVYVGEVGFDLNEIPNNDEYKDSFTDYMIENLTDGVYVDLDDNGEAVDVNAFANSGSEDLIEYETANQVAYEGNLWDGEGTPGEETPAVEELTIESVEALKVNTLEVTFNEAVDTADVTLSVKKGTSSVAAAAPVWNADKTVATITTTAKMTNGEYTVTATSAEALAADEDYVAPTAMTEIVNQYIKEIKVLNDTALTNADSTRAYIYYDVLDQYGESLRTSTSIEWSFSAQKVSDDRANGILTLKKDVAGNATFNYSEQVYVTGVYTKTGVTVTSTVSVGAKQALNGVEVAGFVKKGTAEIVKTLPSAFKAGTYYMVYNVTDQNGSPMTASDPLASNDVTFISDNVLVIKELTTSVTYPETTLTIDGTDYNAVFVTPGISVSNGGEVNITAISNKTGNKVDFNTVVGEDQILTSFTMLAPTTMIADGEAVEVPFEALDQNGEVITNFTTLAKQASFNKLTFTTSAGSVVLYENSDGTATLVYSDDSMGWDSTQALDGIDRTISITSVVVGGTTSSQLLYVQDKARPEAISTIEMDNVIVERGSDTIALTDIEFLDQYGRNMSGSWRNKDGTSYDGQWWNVNRGYRYDNGFFAAATAGKFVGNADYTGFDFMVRATFNGTDGFFENDGVSLTTGLEIEVSTSKDLVLTAENDVVGAALAGFAIKYEIVKTTTDLSAAEATSTAKSEALAIVDIKSVKNYAVADMDKFYVQTKKSSDLTGDTGTALDATTIVAQIPTTDIIGDGIADSTNYEQTVSVSGTYNGQTVSVPSDYLLLSAGKLATASYADNANDVGDSVIVAARTNEVLQVETAVVKSDDVVTTAGNYSVIVTATGMSNSPKTVGVDVVLDDTASMIADKVRAALAADSDVKAFFNVSGLGTNVTITKKTAAANIADVNIDLADDVATTAVGVTEISTSSNVTDGSIADGYTLKWSDFYDASTARYNRKDGADTVKVTVVDLADNNAVIDTVSKAVTIGDATAVAAAINGAETLTGIPANTTINSPAIGSGLIGGSDYSWGTKYYVEDQYGVALTGATATYKVSAIVENADGYAENNFSVTGNDTATVTITGAERGDTFTLTMKSGGVSIDIPVTVTADDNANITDGTNNYQLLINNYLELQRQAGLN